MLEVDKVTDLQGALEVTVRLREDGLKLKRATLVLLDDEEKGISTTPVGTFHGENTMQSTFLADPSSIPSYLEIRDLVAVQEPGIKVFETGKGVP